MAQVNITGTDRRLGISEVFFSSKTHTFLRPVPGSGRFEELEIGEASAEGIEVYSAEVKLGDPPGAFATDFPSTDNLLTQKDYNQWVYEALTSLGDGDIDLDGYATESWVEDKGYITTAAADAKYVAKNITTLSDLPTI